MELARIERAGAENFVVCDTVPGQDSHAAATRHAAACAAHPCGNAVKLAIANTIQCVDIVRGRDECLTEYI